MIDRDEGKANGIQWSKYGSRQQTSEGGNNNLILDSILEGTAESEEEGNESRRYPHEATQPSGGKRKVEEDFCLHGRCGKAHRGKETNENGNT